MRATVLIEIDLIKPNEYGSGVKSKREIDVPVRLNMQGFASVELNVDKLELWPNFAPEPGNAYVWLPLGTVIEHPAVRNVTFR